MNAFKKAASILAASAALLGGMALAGTASAAVVPQHDAAVTSFQAGDIKYDLFQREGSETHYAVATAYVGEQGGVMEVPDYVAAPNHATYDVAGIGEGKQIEGADKVGALTTHGDMVIADEAFTKADALTKVDLSDARYLTVGVRAFAFDHAIKDLVLPADHGREHQIVTLEDESFREVLRDTDYTLQLTHSPSAYQISPKAFSDSNVVVK